MLNFNEIIFVNKILSGIQRHQYLCEVMHGIIIVLSQYLKRYNYVMLKSVVSVDLPPKIDSNAVTF